MQSAKEIVVRERAKDELRRLSEKLEGGPRNRVVWQVVQTVLLSLVIVSNAFLIGNQLEASFLYQASPPGPEVIRTHLEAPSVSLLTTMWFCASIACTVALVMVIMELRTRRRDQVFAEALTIALDDRTA